MLKPQTVEKLAVAESVIASASALAAYLGWLSVGPLRDVLGLSSDECEETLRILLGDGLLEAGDGPVWRFARISDAPMVGNTNGGSPPDSIPL